MLKSVSKLDNYLLSNGTLLNVKFTPATLAGDGGLNKLADFLQAFCKAQAAAYSVQRGQCRHPA
ncbi:hypothetical protein LNP17_10895 [Klebsiella variicola subsp. variicola]|nr:hypothetical protein [Klebsiella variicola subsp. variicola]